MNTSNQRTVSTRNPFAIAVFYLISLLLLPITVIGYIIYVVYLYIAGRRPGVSMTAQGPLSARWSQHHLGTREDEPASRLMMVMPGNPPLGMYLVAAPTLLAHRLTGYVPKAFRYPYEGKVEEQYEASARQTFLDAVVKRHLAEISQFVILGAGFDTRAYRESGAPRRHHVRTFEIDTPKTQAVKRALPEKVGVDTTGVVFVAADFEKDDWMARLVEAGFDPARPALFLWEGVLMYLERSAVESTLRKIAGTAKGSMVAFDYFTTEPLMSSSLYWLALRQGGHQGRRRAAQVRHRQHASNPRAPGRVPPLLRPLTRRAPDARARYPGQACLGRPRYRCSGLMGI